MGVSQRINLIQKPYPSLEGIIPPDGSASLIDGIIDEKGSLRRRPGLFKWHTLLSGEDFIAAAGQGVYYWDAKKIFISVVAGRVFANHTGNPADFIEITNTMTKLHPTNPVCFAASGEWLMMANGRKDQAVLEWNGSSTYATFSSTSPKDVIKLAYIDGYFLALPDNSQLWYYTNASDLEHVYGVTPMAWNQVPLSADGNPDIIKAVAVGWREIMLIGELSTEVWYNSGAELPEPPFARMEGAFIEQGISATNSLALIDNAWFWLNHQREVIRLNGRNPTVISLPIRSQLAGYREVADAIGFKYDRFYVLTFPTENVTWVFDPLMDAWYQWGKWEQEQSKYDRWLVNSVTFVPRWGVSVASSRNNSRLFLIIPGLCTDDNEVLAMEYCSGLLDRGTYRRKICNELILKVKRGAVTDKSIGFDFTFDIPDALRCTYFEYEIPYPGEGASVSVTGLPAGLVFNTGTRRIHGMPTASGVFALTVSVTFASGFTINYPVSFAVLDVTPVILFPGEA